MSPYANNVRESLLSYSDYWLYFPDHVSYYVGFSELDIGGLLTI